MSDEEPHEHYVRLLDTGADQHLMHAGTGEIVQVCGGGAAVEGMQGPLKLAFEGDFACLASRPGDDESVVWVNKVFKQSLHRAPRDGYCGSQLCIAAVGSDISRWAESLEPLMESMMCKHSFAGCMVESELYAHRLPKHRCRQSSIFFVVPHIMKFLYGGDFDHRNSNFVAATTARWRQTLINMGAEAVGNHIRLSAKSRIAEVQARGQAVSAERRLASEREFSISIFGLVIVAAQASVSNKYSALRIVGGRRSSQVVLRWGGGPAQSISLTRCRTKKSIVGGMRRLPLHTLGWGAHPSCRCKIRNVLGCAPSAAVPSIPSQSERCESDSCDPYSYMRPPDVDRSSIALVFGGSRPYIAGAASPGVPPTGVARGVG